MDAATDACLGPMVLKTMLLGFSIAAPIGPIGILCISRTLGGGAALGFATGLGAASLHVAWFLLALPWLQTVATVLPGGATVMSAVACLVTGATGLWIARCRPVAADVGALRPTRGALLSAYASALALAAANPTTLLFYMAAAPAIVPAETRPSGAAAAAAGALLGSAAWWALLCCTVAALRRRLSVRALAAVNRLSGLVLLLLAALMAVGAARTAANGL